MIWTLSALAALWAALALWLLNIRREYKIPRNVKQLALQLNDKPMRQTRSKYGPLTFLEVGQVFPVTTDKQERRKWQAAIWYLNHTTHVRLRMTKKGVRRVA